MLPDVIWILAGHALILIVFPTTIMWAILIPVMKRWKKNYRKKHPFGDCISCHGPVQLASTSGICDACYEADELAKCKSLGDASSEDN